MAKLDKYNTLINDIEELMGGSDNVSFFTHCVTRLRFTVKDRGLVNGDKIKTLGGVVGTNWSGDQFQIIIGPNVEDVFNEINKKSNFEVGKVAAVGELKTDKKVTIGSVLDAIAGSIVPLVPVLIAGGLTKVILLILTQAHILTSKSPTYVTLSFVADAAFYFLPVFAGATTAKKFKANVGLGMLMGAIMIHPTFVQLAASKQALSIFKLPIYHGSYASTIFPVLIAVFLMSYVERFFNKHIPAAIRTMSVPVLTLLVMAPLTLCLIAPIGGFLGNYVAAGLAWLYSTTGFVGIAILAALIPLIVMTGMHVALGPILIQNFASIGSDPFIAVANYVATFNVGAACLGIALKTKSRTLKETAYSCAITAMVGGITEPALYGLILQRRKALYGSMIGSLVGGSLMGLLHVVCYAFPGNMGLFGLPALVGKTSTNLIFAIISIAIGVVSTVIATMILYKDKDITVNSVKEMEAV